MRELLMRVGLASLLVVAVFACAAPESESEASEASGEVATYVVRGRVLEPWDGERLALRHEPITDFVGVSGDPEPMAEMSMRFPVAPELPAESLAAESLAVGDAVQFELSVDWQRRPPHQIESIEPLPVGSTLQLNR